ncbi:ChaN family lipoprotein [Pseudomonas sp. N040]|uniref:ChaN family lipoprotein n=1 Tax=Pseudomonas sp. N040 TaxID=2785325 RepID=UPI0018A29250|nr:ChaN family lipoprotein [Pseudomonas sp. N040]MBF7730430.1 ChaN family lipoprotein [Pseudomonas sp. N040]MBW7014073.1 ChaN family lipoprotein [Pseudomonas sp. N040]
MRILLLALAGLLAACQSQTPELPLLPAWQAPEAREHADLGVILDLRSGQRLTPLQLVEQLAAAPRLLVGEQHDNPDHHALQLWLLRALAAQRPQGSLLLEMLNPNQQAAVDQVHADYANGQPPADLYQALAWQANWDWGLYGAIVAYALQQPWPLQSANLDRSEIMTIYAAPPPLAGRASTAPAVRAALLEQIRQSHCGLLPESQLPAMLAVQQQRDRRMAEQLHDAPQPALLLAGAFHVRRDLGVPLHLQDLGSADGAQVLLLAEAGQPVTAAEADFVWFTAAQPEQDHCAKLRR